MFANVARSIVRLFESGVQSPSMPAGIPSELLVLVERVVRPLPIPLDRQKRLRADFLDHLQTIHAEELARDGNSAAALARTMQRFGDPVELTAELRASIRWSESGKCWFERFWSQRPAESSPWYVVRLISRFAIIVSLWIGLMMADLHAFGSQPVSLSRIMSALGAVTFLTVWLGCFLLFGLHAGAEWEQPQRRWRRILPFSIALTASWPLSLVIMMLIAGGTWIDYSIPLIGTVVGGVFSVVCGTFVGVLHCRDMRYRAEWERLNLDAVSLSCSS